MNDCPHGVELTRTTRDGWPLCPFCRRRAKLAAPPALPTIKPPLFDAAVLAAGDDTLTLEIPDER